MKPIHCHEINVIAAERCSCSTLARIAAHLGLIDPVQANAVEAITEESGWFLFHILAQDGCVVSESLFKAMRLAVDAAGYPGKEFCVTAIKEGSTLVPPKGHVHASVPVYEGLEEVPF